MRKSSGRRRISLASWALALLVLLFVAACGSAPSAPATTTVATGPAVVAADGGSGVVAVAVDEGQLPVGARDPVWGSPTAPLTLVVFSDFQCPFCARHAQNVDALKLRYGPETLRIAYKHNPLDFHEDAYDAAAIGAAVHQLGGDTAFWAYHDAIYAPGVNLREMDAVIERALGAAARVAPLAADQVVATAKDRGSAKVDEDLKLGQRFGVRGTPASFLNGVFISGAQPLEELMRLHDAELVAARAELERGVPPTALYSKRVADNAKGIEVGAAGAEPPPPERPSKPEIDTKVWKVPVGASPSRGPASALVTIVTFTDLECPYCAKLSGTLGELDRRFPGKLRFVHKHRPLAFHKNARPASELLARIHAQKGDAAFWAAHDSIFDGWAPGKLDETALDALAVKAGLPTARRVAKNDLEKHARTVELDERLADDVEVRGTPQSFVNGRRVSGSQALEVFVGVVDEELAKAEALVRTGVRPDAVYDTITGGGQTSFPPERVTLPAADPHTAKRGLPGAPVVITVFTDFQCPFCRKHADTIAAIEKELKASVRVELRHNALPYHPNAHAAASLALEARKQKGDAGFWKIHDALFADQRGLDREGLLQKARDAGLDVAKVTQALDANVYTGELDTDAALARAMGFDGTPVTVVNGYVLEGAVPIEKLRRVVQHALDEARPAKKR
jgi:protein-disulfide isomerase